MQVTFWAYSKRRNSTAQPTGTGDAYACVLKSPSGVLNPAIILDVGLSTSPAAYNYAYIPEYGRYYWVTEWTFANACWEASLQVDVLASWKTYIGASSMYMLRSAGEYDGSIQDMLYPMTATQTHDIVGTVTPWKQLITLGTYVVGIMGPGSGVGAVTYYAMTQGQFNNFTSYLFGGTSWAAVTDISDNLLKTMFNPLQYVVSCEWFPLDGFAGTAVASINYGWWTLPVSATQLTGVYTSGSFTLSGIPKHPQAAARGKYLNLQPYSRYWFEFQPFGVLPVDSSMLQDATDFDVRWRVDYITGVGTCWYGYIYTGEQSGPNVAQAKVSVSVQLAQLANNPIGAIAGAVEVAAGVATGGAAALLGSGFGLKSVADSLMPQVSVMGANGGFSGFNARPILHAQFFTAADDDNSLLGRPLCKTRTPAALGGYMVADKSQVSAPATDDELAQIAGFVESGFFYE